MTTIINTVGGTRDEMTGYIWDDCVYYHLVTDNIGYK
jgi:hypothetical protein